MRRACGAVPTGPTSSMTSRSAGHACIRIAVQRSSAASSSRQRGTPAGAASGAALRARSTRRPSARSSSQRSTPWAPRSSTATTPRTVSPAARAACASSRQRLVLPDPGSPVSTSRRLPKESAASALRRPGAFLLSRHDRAAPRAHSGTSCTRTSSLTDSPARKPMKLAPTKRYGPSHFGSGLPSRSLAMIQSLLPMIVRLSTVQT